MREAVDEAWEFALLMAEQSEDRSVARGAWFDLAHFWARLGDRLWPTA